MRLVRRGMRILGCVGAAAAMVVAGASIASATGTVNAAVTAANPEIGAKILPYEKLYERTTTPTRALPALPKQALLQATSALSAELGLPQNPAQILDADLSPEVAGRLANVLTDLLSCHRLTKLAYAGIPQSLLPEVLKNGGGLDPAAYTGIRLCGESAWRSTNELELAVADQLPNSAGCQALGQVDLDIWPVLRVDGACRDNRYDNDYLLTLDVGGNDTYANNAGSNMVDLNFSPAGSTVAGLRGTGPAKGCQRAIPGLTALDCVPTAAVVLDMQGSDVYGVKQTPDHDTGCTNDPVIRRMMTGGAGFLGVGILRDVEGDDTYTGKTGSLGAGHIFGVGILSDGSGDDSYRAVRNSEGFALVGGIGVLRDEAGADTYGFYMPAPINPGAPNQTEGAGGVRDDEGEGLCDRIPRFTQGAGNVAGATGIFLDDAGADHYHGAFAGEFVGPFQVPSTRAGSLGFGNNQGLGVFLDRGAVNDQYTVDGEPTVAGVPKRGDNVIVQPGNDSTGSGFGQGLFVDQ
ncbi:hypothetical protein N5079_32230 [Planotetraspora sp. A-T 1434]|uniref:hypothetical protein n=1 Tax=Planotetraspora sp. A-T 1434 TaxID=2979219 RepID=UPI0021BE8800|nr:hypothetical protein [Planotetraspora sp. A-T 1434]MCT9934885.1 hypothetical protein [Planotetraspora sp. A-T 1434]